MPETLDLAQDLRDLVHLAADLDALDDLLRRGLDWLARLAPYDVATIFRLDGGQLTVRAARGPLASRVRGHRLELAAFPTIREALEDRRARAYTEDDHAHGDGDPFDGVLDLPAGHSCMVVPLCTGARCFGVLTLDRSVCEPYPQPVVDLVEVYGQILALAIHNAENAALLERVAVQEREHARLLEDRLGGPVDDSLAPAMRETLGRARQVAGTDTPVLVLGETGTGKERLARAIHGWSGRRDRPFVALNCAAIPANLVESELFGHSRGAFTGATQARSGRFQVANGGTLLLDEIGELPLDLQAKLLRVLQEGTFAPVGSDRDVRVDVRVVAATHVDLQRAVKDGRFREDLYYRLAVFPLRVPALRERLEDLPHLCEALLDEVAARTGRRGMRLGPGAVDRLRTHGWPGNVRELANVLERATILATGRVIGPELLDLGAPAAPVAREIAAPELVSLDEAQRRHIARVLDATSGRIYGPGGAAEILGMKPSTLQSRMKKLGLSRRAA